MKNFSIILFTILICLSTSNFNDEEENDFQTNYDESKMMILLLGPTRSGKSCFINTITSYNFAKTGDDSGDSTTKDHEIYESFIDGFSRREKYKIVDSMGLDDSDESGISDPMILASTLIGIKEEIQKNNGILKSIYIFESLTNDSNQIQKTINKLKGAFGEEISKNIVVILNKNPNPNKRRLNNIINKLKSEKIEHYIHWLSGCGKNKLSDEYYDQMKELHSMTSETDSITAKQLGKFLENLEKEGRNIFHENKDNIFKKFRKYYNYGSLALSLLQVMNLQFLVASNIAAVALEKIYEKLEENPKFLVSLAIEDRLKKYFNKKKDL